MSSTRNLNRLSSENERLRQELEEARDALRAIRSGEVDALLVSTAAGDQVFTLEGADSPYRLAIENVNEGVLTLGRDGAILYGNRSFSRLLQQRLPRLPGMQIREFIAPHSLAALEGLFAHGSGRREVDLLARDGSAVPVHLSLSRMRIGGLAAYCAIFTDLREQKRREYQIADGALIQSILAHSDQAIVVLDSSGIIKYASNAADALAGRQITGAGFDEAFSGIRHQGKAISLGAIAGREIASRAEMQCDGSEGPRTLLFSHGELSSEGGTLGHVVSFLDTTERRKLRDALEESQKRHKALVETTADFIWETDSRGRYTYCSPQLNTLWGYEAGDLLGKTPFDLMPEPERAIAMQHFEALAASPAGFSMELRCFSKEGQVVDLEVSGTPFFDRQGRLQGFRGVSRDITQRKKGEEELSQRTAELARERQRFFDVLETLPVMICLMTPDHHVPFSNRAFREKFGESGGRRCYEYCRGATEPCDFCQSFRPLKTGQPHRWELVLADGESIIDAYDLPFKDMDGSPLILEMDMDITGRRRAEESLRRTEEALRAYSSELEAANREVESFSYTVSHDLRAPLRKMDGFSEILLQDYADRLDDTGRDYLKRIRNASQTMAQLIDGMLKLASISRADLRLDRLDLSRIAEAIIRDLRAAEPDRRVESVIQPGVRVVGDGQLLRILMNNLLENAWKYTSGRQDARIEFGTNRQRGNLVCFVRDNGIGFDHKYAGKLFQPFQRLHTSGAYAGSGIGLAIARRVVQRHGGHIWAEARPDLGASFHFVLGTARK